MALAVGVSASIGLALGLRFNVFILIPTIILAVVSTGVVHATRGDQALSVVVTIVLVATTLQICYLVGSVTSVAFERNVPLERSKDLAINILGHMEVGGIGWRACGNRRPHRKCGPYCLNKRRSESRW